MGLPPGQCGPSQGLPRPVLGSLGIPGLAGPSAPPVPLPAPPLADQAVPCPPALWSGPAPGPWPGRGPSSRHPPLLCRLQQAGPRGAGPPPDRAGSLTAPKGPWELLLRPLPSPPRPFSGARLGASAQGSRLLPASCISAPPPSPTEGVSRAPSGSLLSAQHRPAPRPLGTPSGPALGMEQALATGGREQLADAASTKPGHAARPRPRRVGHPG